LDGPKRLRLWGSLGLQGAPAARRSRFRGTSGL